VSNLQCEQCELSMWTFIFNLHLIFFKSIVTLWSMCSIIPSQCIFYIIRNNTILFTHAKYRKTLEKIFAPFDPFKKKFSNSLHCIFHLPKKITKWMTMQSLASQGYEFLYNKVFLTCHHGTFCDLLSYSNDGIAYWNLHVES